MLMRAGRFGVLEDAFVYAGVRFWVMRHSPGLALQGGGLATNTPVSVGDQAAASVTDPLSECGHPQSASGRPGDNGVSTPSNGSPALCRSSRRSISPAIAFSTNWDQFRSLSAELVAL